MDDAKGNERARSSSSGVRDAYEGFSDSGGAGYTRWHGKQQKRVETKANQGPRITLGDQGANTAFVQLGSLRMLDIEVDHEDQDRVVTSA